MTSVITSWLSNIDSVDYTLVDPPTPQADEYFRQQQHRLHSEGIKPWPLADRSGHERRSSRCSYSNDNFDEEENPKESYSSDGSDWSDAISTLGQWTACAANVVASTITSTTKQLSASLSNVSTGSQDIRRVGREMKLKSTSAYVGKTSYAKGIDRSYLKDSPHHPECHQRSVGAYIGYLADHFTAPKISARKDRWID